MKRGLEAQGARMSGIPDGRAEIGYNEISRGEVPADFARLISG